MHASKRRKQEESPRRVIQFRSNSTQLSLSLSLSLSEALYLPTFSHLLIVNQLLSRRSGDRKGMIPARPLYQGVGASVWDPELSKERVDNSGNGLVPLVCC